MLWNGGNLCEKITHSFSVGVSMDFVCIYTTDVSCNYVSVDSIFSFSSFLSIKAFQAFQAPRVDNNPLP